jgi:hypothetical protein
VSAAAIPHVTIILERVFRALHFSTIREPGISRRK